MPSTLIKRIVGGTEHLSLAEKINVRDNVSRAASRGEFKIPINLFCGVLQEVIAQRSGAGVLASRLTASERADAIAIRNLVVAQTFSVFEVYLILIMGEEGIYTPEQIETIFGL